MEELHERRPHAEPTTHHPLPSPKKKKTRPHGPQYKPRKTKAKPLTILKRRAIDEKVQTAAFRPVEDFITKSFSARLWTSRFHLLDHRSFRDGVHRDQFRWHSWVGTLLGLHPLGQAPFPQSWAGARGVPARFRMGSGVAVVFPGLYCGPCGSVVFLEVFWV